MTPQEAFEQFSAKWFMGEVEHVHAAWNVNDNDYTVPGSFLGESMQLALRTAWHSWQASRLATQEEDCRKAAALIRQLARDLQYDGLLYEGGANRMRKVADGIEKRGAMAASPIREGMAE